MAIRGVSTANAYRSVQDQEWLDLLAGTERAGTTWRKSARLETVPV